MSIHGADGRPGPLSDLDTDRWKHTSVRLGMLTGSWQGPAADRLGMFFAPEALEFLPPAETSHNPFLAIHQQTAVLYDKEPAVEGEGASEEDLAKVVTPELWPQQQQTLLWTLGLNDAFVYTTLTDDGLRYHVVSPSDLAAIVPDPENPDQPIALSYLQLTVRPGNDPEPIVEWTWTTWDLRDENNPIFKIEVDSGQADESIGRKDVTTIYMPELKAGNYPLWTEGAIGEGSPVMPWVAYHHMIGNRILSPMVGQEIVDGTLTVSALMTMWTGGFRDGAHPQRVAVDLEVVGAKATNDMAGSKPGGAVVRMNQTAVMMFRSQSDKNGSITHFPPAMDPKSAGEAVAAFSAQLAVYAGFSPGDVSLKGGSVGQSGYAISISREGIRRARGRLIPPMMRSDRLLLSLGAVLANAYLGTQLPTEPALWTIRYQGMDKSLEEVKAELEEARALRAAGVLGMVDYFLRFNPGLTREQAIGKMMDNAAEEATIDAAIRGMTGSVPDDGRFLIGDKTTAQDLAVSVESGTLSRTTAMALLTSMIGTTQEEAEAILSGPTRTSVEGNP